MRLRRPLRISIQSRNSALPPSWEAFLREVRRQPEIQACERQVPYSWMGWHESKPATRVNVLETTCGEALIR